MIIRSKAPLRLGLAGGGTDVSPYCDIYTGYILNVTINLYAHCTIETLDDDSLEFFASDIGESFHGKADNSVLPIDGNLDLIKGVYNFVLNHEGKIPPCRITTYSDVPAGSGLGSSSTMVVAILRAFSEWLNIPFGEYEIAHNAYVIERIDLNQAGGKQDQYAATFGGFNFMEFGSNNAVIVNPLRVKRWIVDELESSLLLYYTGVSRYSSAVIEEQRKNTINKVGYALEAMHKVKQSAIDMKYAILKGDVDFVGKILGDSWEQKKKMASSISNKDIQDIFDVATAAGAKYGKISGAGGGGVIMFFVDPVKKYNVKVALDKLTGKCIDFHFDEDGTHSWKIYK